MLEFEDATCGVSEIIEVARMMGQPDYLVRVVAADAEQEFYQTFCSLEIRVRVVLRPVLVVGAVAQVALVWE